VRQALAGRAAEMVFYERNKASDPDAGVNVGAAADLKDATDVLRKAICSFGLFEDFGMVVRSDAERNGAAVSDYINGILKEQLDAAILIIRHNLPAMEELVGALKERDFLSGEDIKEILQKQGVKRAEK
jgi:ATP-dependent Zn protease